MFIITWIQLCVKMIINADLIYADYSDFFLDNDL